MWTFLVVLGFVSFGWYLFGVVGLADDLRRGDEQ